MTLIDRIPSMKDTELAQLLRTARKLDVSGTPEQRRLAAEVAPALEREASRRRERVLMTRRAATSRF